MTFTELMTYFQLTDRLVERPFNVVLTEGLLNEVYVTFGHRVIKIVYANMDDADDLQFMSLNIIQSDPNRLPPFNTFSTLSESTAILKIEEMLTNERN